MNIFGWKSTGRGLLRPAKARVQQDRLSAIRSYGQASLGEWPRCYEQQLREGYLVNAIAQRAVRLVVEGLASAPLTSNDDAALALVKATSGGQALIETVAAHLLLHGNAYVEILPGIDGRPAELFALRPERVSVEADMRGWPVAYVYKAGEVASRLPADCIIHIRAMHPLDDHYGLGCLGAASGAVAIHNAATKWNKALLDNAARPSGALVYEAGDAGTLSGDQYTRLKEELAASFQGAGNAGRPMLLEGGLKWQAMALTPAEMDFAGLKEAAAREIALAFGVPPVLLGLPGDATYANYREANRALWSQGILPLARKIFDALGEGLRPWFDGLVLGVDLNAVPALAEDRERLWVQVTAADFLTMEEKRAAVGLEPQSAAEADLQDSTENEAGAAEFKFNPWHDTRNGQFAFEGQGQRFAASGGSFGGGGASGSWGKPQPKNPSTTPKPKKRVIVTPLPKTIVKQPTVKAPLKPFPKKVRKTEPPELPPTNTPETSKPIGAPPPKPDTGALEVAAVAGAALATVAKPVAANTVSASGYNFGVDVGVRTVGAAGKLRLEPNQRRSRSAQTNAGKPDRQPSDHGGHFIAREFGGPEIPANHFAQDAKVNRSQYRKLELIWKKVLKRNQEVDVDIVPKYKGDSVRPHSLHVKYTINGKTVRKIIPNIKGEK